MTGIARNTADHEYNAIAGRHHEKMVNTDSVLSGPVTRKRNVPGRRTSAPTTAPPATTVEL